MVSDISSCLI